MTATKVHVFSLPQLKQIKLSLLIQNTRHNIHPRSDILNWINEFRMAVFCQEISKLGPMFHHLDKSGDVS